MLLVKNLPANAGDARNLGLIPGLGRSHGVGNGNLLQYSCLEKSCGQRSLAGYSIWGHKELDMTEHAYTHTGIQQIFIEWMNGCISKRHLTYNLAKIKLFSVLPYKCVLPLYLVLSRDPTFQNHFFLALVSSSWPVHQQLVSFLLYFQTVSPIFSPLSISPACPQFQTIMTSHLLMSPPAFILLQAYFQNPFFAQHISSCWSGWSLRFEPNPN